MVESNSQVKTARKSLTVSERAYGRVENEAARHKRSARQQGMQRRGGTASSTHHGRAHAFVSQRSAEPNVGW